MEILGYLLSVMIGVSLGLIGGGGSILTVPVLVYVMGVSPVLSTAYSLFIVGLTALVGSFNYGKKGLLDYKTALIFGLPSIVTVYATRKFIVPVIPETVFNIGSFTVSKDLFVMLLFALLMVAASVSMIRDKRSGNGDATREKKYNYPLIFAEGIVVGALTGLVGAGGGFLIIPALVLLAGLPMKEAVGTSLLIIAAKSLIGFLGDIGNQVIEWHFLLMFSLFAVAGIFVGTALSRRISGDKLKPAFGWFVLIMGIYIIAKEVFFHA
ncbi:MAG: sulfite exporter TauE/SafE family protein [Lewinellaceae bacterium]|nr:sulfite exporter TauE/SafE family protein [Saprospiraceae bacterium]MCB9305383.1 sulfite exporter TauE/SafE family protein [Lewinellaceae bacterium]